MSVIHVTKITILRGEGSDKVYFTTTLTPSVWPYTDSPSARIEVAAGTAETWLEANGFNDYTVVKVG